MPDYLPSIMNLAAIASELGITDAVLSPGSRNAPLLLALARHPAIQTHIMIDERSAAFVAIGLAQQQQRPVILACTSGTAPLNYAPAIAEAYYQQIPLILVTADRPPEWIDQQDGQTLDQTSLYSNSIKGRYQFPVDTGHPDAIWQTERDLGEAIHLAHSQPWGPVHINVPLREPFYPAEDEEIRFAPGKVIRQMQGRALLSEAQWTDLMGQIEGSERLLVVVGQGRLDPLTSRALAHLKLPVLGEIISNLHSTPGIICHADLFLSDASPPLLEALRPDLLISCGLSLVSKRLKQYLRAYPARRHWHIQAAGKVADTYQSLTQVIRLEPVDFWSELARRLPSNQGGDYAAQWRSLERRSIQFIDEFFAQPAPWGEFCAVHQILASLPEPCLLHLGNSMAVRYANLVGLGARQIQVFSNRGTSGIEGCLSTAVGHSKGSQLLNLVILGDVSFFYDRNGLWSGQPLPNNLRILLLNNDGGGIFELLPDSGRLPECEAYFVTPHGLNGANSARDFDLDYQLCRDQAQLTACLDHFFAPNDKPRLLEICTDRAANRTLFQQFKQHWSQLCPPPHGNP
jgi:2-succinyl-5-enolpyruvyl-6-hydroxy-3-cyclohexene-1-carboxylate synthase